MKKIIYLIFTICLFSNCGSKNDATPEQEGVFIKLLGGGSSDAATEFFFNDKNTIVGLGTTESFELPNTNPSNALLFRADEFGNKTLMKGIGGIKGDAIRPTADGGMIVVSSSPTALSNDYFYLIKLKADNTIQWTKTFSPKDKNNNPLDILNATVEQTPAGGYIIVFSSLYKTPTLNQEYVYIWGLDATGNIQREIYYGNPAVKNLTTKSRILANGDVVIAGRYNQYMRIMLSNSIAGVKWDYNLYHQEANETAIGNDVEIGNAGFAVAGTITRTNGETDGLVIKTNSDGKIEWQRRFGGEFNQTIRSITKTDDGYVITGTTEVVFKGLLNDNIWVAKLNNGGEVLWQKDFGGAKDDVGLCVKINSKGYITILGTIVYETTPMLVLIQLNPNGETKK